jgi:hypothetical protein
MPHRYPNEAAPAHLCETSTGGLPQGKRGTAINESDFPDDVREMALALPEVTEQDHHGRASFRVRGKIFATVPDDQHLRVMLDEGEIRAAVSQNPVVFHEFFWGRRLACLVVDLPGPTLPQLRELLADAWLRKAPIALARPLQSQA